MRTLSLIVALVLVAPLCASDVDRVRAARALASAKAAAQQPIRASVIVIEEEPTAEAPTACLSYEAALARVKKDGCKLAVFLNCPCVPGNYLCASAGGFGPYKEPMVCLVQPLNGGAVWSRNLPASSTSAEITAALKRAPDCTCGPDCPCASCDGNGSCPMSRARLQAQQGGCANGQCGSFGGFQQFMGGFGGCSSCAGGRCR